MCVFKTSLHPVGLRSYFQVDQIAELSKLRQKHVNHMGTSKHLLLLLEAFFLFVCLFVVVVVLKIYGFFFIADNAATTY